MSETENAKTVIAEDVEVVGSIKCGSNIDVRGRVNGDINCSGNALISESANVKGNITVTSGVIKGQIHGNVTAKDRIELKATARISGDVRAKSLVVEDGVTIVGKFEVNATASSLPRPTSSESRSTIQEITPTEPVDADPKVQARKEEIRQSVAQDTKKGGLFSRK